MLAATNFIQRSSTDPESRRYQVALDILVGIQILAGLINVLLLAPLWMQLLHLLLADPIWIVLVLFSVSDLSEDRADASQDPGMSLSAADL